MFYSILKRILIYNFAKKFSKMKKIFFSFFVIVFSFQFFSVKSNNVFDNPDSTQKLIYVKSILRNVIDNSNVSNFIDNTIPTVLPFGISKGIVPDEENVVIVLDNIVFTPQGGYLDAYTLVKEPNSQDTTLAFEATNIKFNNGGFIGDAKLTLICDVTKKLIDSASITIQKGGTFVEWQCNGFKQLGIQGKISFNRNFIVPENSDGSQDSTGKVVYASFNTIIKSWNDLILEVSLLPFQFTKLKGFGFTLNSAVLDLSNTKNSQSIIFPPNYRTPSMPSINSTFWQGLFLKQITVKCPPEFKKNNSNERITFGASNMLIDELGFTAELFANNLISIENGNAGGWAFSLDTINIKIEKNTFINTKIAGNIQLPITDQQSAFHYSGFIDNTGNYFLNVNIKNTLNVPMWAASINVFPNSGVTLQRINKQLVATALLNGKISVQTAGDSPLSINGIEFQGLKIQNVQPRLDIQHVSFAGTNQNKLSNFPLTINQLEFVRQEPNIGLSFNVALNLVGADSNGFSANGGFAIWAEPTNNNNLLGWKYKNFQVNNFALNIDAGAFAFNGELIVFRQNTVFGNGFKGNVSARFEPGFSIAASVQFGSVNGFRYWYADALLTVPTGIPIGQSGIGIFGFGGGAYYRMSRVVPQNINIPIDPANNPSDNSNNPGVSLSGVTYQPSSIVGLGVKASVIWGTYPAPDAFNSMSTFEIAFNSGGGVNRISLSGDGYYMTPLSKRGANSVCYATAFVDYDFVNHALHGQSNLFVNLAPALDGIGPNHLAGYTVMHFDPSVWYIYIGTPQNRVGVKALNTFNLSAYLMMGKVVPDIPAPPAEVLNQIPNISNNRDYSALTSANGFAFGASLTANIDKSFWYFYGNFNAGVGFDFMMKNYGTDTRCDGSNQPIGIFGWYAQGQAYAYLIGKIGLNVEEGIFKGKYEIMNLQAAILMQAKLPNPMWMAGQVNGSYSILNGLVKGSVNYKFEIGQQCNIVAGTGISGMKIIAEVSPSANATNIDVFNNPQVAFSMKVGQTFQFVDINNNTKTYKIVLDYLKLKHNNNEIQGSLNWNSDNTVVVFSPTDILPGEANINLSVKVHCEELVNNIWKKVIINGQNSEESKEFSFTTDKAPDYIPQSNVALSYPLKNQLNLYINESNTGFITLKQGQDYLFEENYDWYQKVRFKTDNSTMDVNFNYDANLNKISFSIPNNLQKQKITCLYVVNIPKNTSQQIDQNVINTQIVMNDTTGSNVKIESKDIEGTYTKYIDKEIYSMYFRTSKYNTFAQKIDAFQWSASWSWVYNDINGIHEIGKSFTADEYFDQYEIEGTANMPPLVQIVTVNDNYWFNNYSNPLMYNPLICASCSPKFPADITLNVQNRENIGIPPTKTSFLRQDPFNTLLLTEQNIASNSFQFNYYSGYIKNIMDYYQYKDYTILQNQAANHSQRATNIALKNILNSSYTSMLAGYPNYYYYKVVFKYFIPGSENNTSQKEISIGY